METQYTKGATQGSATSTVRLTDADRPAALVTVYTMTYGSPNAGWLVSITLPSVIAQDGEH